jgi:hypothetical protein
MEIEILAQNIDIPLAPSLEQDLNLGKSTKMGFYFSLALPYLLSIGKTTGHILTNCTLSEEIWNQDTQLMRRTKWVKDNIMSTIRGWGTESYKVKS